MNGTIILILITCIVASFVTEKAAKKINIETEDDATGLALEISNEHILLPIADVENIEKLLEFAIFIKDKKSTNPVSILSVVSNNLEAEANILKARNKLGEYVKQASASEIKANIITTIDHNAASGISRISREIMANIIILGWPRRTGFIDKLVGDKVDGILNNTDKTTFICHIYKPLVLHKRIVVVVPPLAEHENGFEQWLIKVAKLAQELSIPIHLYNNDSTEKSVEKVIKLAKLSLSLNFTLFNDWDNFLALTRNILSDDLFILISARTGATSHITALENLPSKLEKYFPVNSKIIIYPQQFNQNFARERYEDISSQPLNKGIETIQKISKGIGNIFKKDNNE